MAPAPSSLGSSIASSKLAVFAIGGLSALFAVWAARYVSNIEGSLLPTQWLKARRHQGDDEADVTDGADVPENAPDHCPGLQSEDAGKAAACDGCPNQRICSSGEGKSRLLIDPAVVEIQQKLSKVQRKILVLSGKGGVGKSTVSSQLAWALQQRGFDVGLLDIDICGPSIPRMTGCNGADVHSSADGWSPIYVADNLAVMSIGFLLPDPDDAVIWRGPKKNGLIRQFLTDVTWGSLDFLIIDTPPGTSDEHLSIVTYLKEAHVDGAVVVTTPQEIALQDVRKEINFCKKVEMPILGVVENMADSLFCSQESQKSGGAKGMCERMGVPYAGAIPMDKVVVEACEGGEPLGRVAPKSRAYRRLNEIVDSLLEVVHYPRKGTEPSGLSNEEGNRTSSTREDEEEEEDDDAASSVESSSPPITQEIAKGKRRRQRGRKNKKAGEETGGSSVAESSA